MRPIGRSPARTTPPQGRRTGAGATRGLARWGLQVSCAERTEVTAAVSQIAEVSPRFVTVGPGTGLSFVGNENALSTIEHPLSRGGPGWTAAVRRSVDGRFADSAGPTGVAPA